MSEQKTSGWESRFLLFTLPILIAVTVAFFWPVFSSWMIPAVPMHNVSKKKSDNQTSVVERQVKALSLLGVVVNPIDPHATSAQAIVRNQQGQAKIYHLNDTVVGDYRLTAVYPSSIQVADGKGHAVLISLPKKKGVS